MRRILTLLAVLGPLAPTVLATCDPPSAPATQPTPSCASSGVTIPAAGYDNTENIYWWSCCDANAGCLSFQPGIYPTRFHRFYYEYSNGTTTCYDTGHTYTSDDPRYGCCDTVRHTED